MYTLPIDTKITEQVLLDVIEYNEKYIKRYEKLEDYYMGKHDILKRSKEEILKNNKVMVNHAKYITDTNIGYLLGNPVDYKVNEQYDITPLLDVYKKQTINDLDSEIAKDVSIFGIQREYVYSDEKSEPRSCEIDNKNSVLVYDDTVEHKKLFGLVYRKIFKGDKFIYYEVIYCDKKVTRKYQLSDKKLKQCEKDKPHVFGDVPLIEYKNNPELLGDYESVLSLIDAYNILQSDRINDKEQLVDAILLFYGMDFDSEQADLLSYNRIIANIPQDGKVDYLIKAMQEADVDVLRKTIEADIHKISMVPNMSDTNFVGNSSGVAIRYKLLAFEQNIKNKERYFEKGLMERFKLYNNFLTTKSKMQQIPIEEVDAVFTRNLPSNDLEISQTINNISDFVDTETLISQLSFIRDAKEVMKKKEKEESVKPTETYDEFGEKVTEVEKDNEIE